MRRTFAVLATVFTVLSVGLAPASASAAVPIDPSTSNQVGRTASTNAPEADWHLLFWEITGPWVAHLMCVDVVGAQPHSGAGLHLWDCHGHANQQWRIGEPGSSSSTILSWDGRCLDSHDKGTANRTRAVVSDCDGSRSQQWQFWYAPNGAVTLRQVSSRMCLEVYKSRRANGTAIEISDCTAFDDQRFMWLDGAAPV